MTDLKYHMPAVGSEVETFTVTHTDHGPVIRLKMSKNDPRACPLCTEQITSAMIAGAIEISYEVHWQPETGKTVNVMNVGGDLSYIYQPCACVFYLGASL
jgi:hypothetical protein